MNSNVIIGKVARKELLLFFASPVAWLFLASFLIVSLFTFFWVESFFARNIADVRPLFEWMPLLLLFLSSALTMRSWSDERRSGTLEYVLTLPAGIWQFVLGKFLACAMILLLALLATLPVPFTVASLTALDWGPVLAGYLAALLLGCAYLAVGLFVSSRTDNAIVSLMGSIAICSLLYIAGSDLLLGFFGSNVGEVLSLLSTSARFESITRGVIDMRDLYYYFAVTTVFLALNVLGLEQGRWSRGGNRRHRRWRWGTALLIANVIVAGVSLQAFRTLRVDVTQGQLYSLSEPSMGVLEQIEEPLLIRGYFSERSHPLLAPLVPQLRDLLQEYAVAANGAIRVEFVDPAQDAEAEQAANEDYGITATPFQVADRYQSALVNAYFDVLIQYGDEFETLGFSDFIEIKGSTVGDPEVMLRNPEFDITRAIRDVIYSYRSGGELFAQIESPVTLRAYISPDDSLPQLLSEYRAEILEEAQTLVESSQGKLNIEVIDPDAGDGSVAERIISEWGFQPMLAATGDAGEFYFYLTLEDDHQVIQLPTGAFDSSEFAGALDAGLRRFARGFTRNISIALPTPEAPVPGAPPASHSFGSVQQAISEDYTIRMEDLSDGSIDPSADALLVIAPENLDELGRFAIDQYLMRGGTVVLATSPYSIESQGPSLLLRDVTSGLEDWLAGFGVQIEETVILDPRSSVFPVPVVRRVGGYEFREMQFVDYPYLLDVRDDGLNAEHPVTAGLPNVTVGWASPITASVSDGRSVTTLLETSGDAWVSEERDVMPAMDDAGNTLFQAPAGPRQKASIGVLLEGVFESSFTEPPSAPPVASTDGEAPVEPPRSLVARSPASARLLVIASNDFASDQVLSGVIAASGNQYFGPLELLLNSVDWAVEDATLTRIRSRAHFNRTLPPMDATTMASIEYGNYGVALLIVAILFLAWRVIRGQRNLRLARMIT